MVTDRSVLIVSVSKNILIHLWSIMGFPGGSVVKNLPAMVGNICVTKDVLIRLWSVMC